MLHGDINAGSADGCMSIIKDRGDRAQYHFAGCRIDVGFCQQRITSADALIPFARCDIPAFFGGESVRLGQDACIQIGNPHGHDILRVCVDDV